MLDNFRFRKTGAVVAGQVVYVLELRTQQVEIHVNMTRNLALILHAEIGRVLYSVVESNSFKGVIMVQAYSDPKRAGDPHALPDVEVFYIGKGDAQQDCPLCGATGVADQADNAPETSNLHVMDHFGWYWWACFPGCLPDGEPNGPFATEAEALAAAQEGNNNE